MVSVLARVVRRNSYSSVVMELPGTYIQEGRAWRLAPSLTLTEHYSHVTEQPLCSPELLALVPLGTCRYL